MEGPSAFYPKVEKLAKTWENYANIKFKFVPKGYSDIRIGFNPKLGWFSEIGILALNKSKNDVTMNLVMVYGDVDVVRNGVLHEFGHALGLMHEHQSPVSPIRWDEKKLIRLYKKTYGWEEKDIRDGIIRKVNSINYSKFDRKSIMYDVDKRWTKDGRSIVSTTNLSKMEKEFIGIETKT